LNSQAVMVKAVHLIYFKEMADCRKLDNQTP